MDIESLNEEMTRRARRITVTGYREWKIRRSLRGSGQAEREKTLRSAVLRRDQGNRASRRQGDGRKPRADRRSHFGAPGLWGSGDTPVAQDDTRRNSGGRQWRQTEGGPERGSGDDRFGHRR